MCSSYAVGVASGRVGGGESPSEVSATMAQGASEASNHSALFSEVPMPVGGRALPGFSRPRQPELLERAAFDAHACSGDMRLSALGQEARGVREALAA